MLFTLRDRIRKQLNLFAAQPQESNLNSQNMDETIFTDQVTWFIDDTQVYGVTSHTTVEGNKVTKTTNGCLLVFDPKSGILRVKVIHKDAWAGMKRIRTLGPQKSAEEIATIIASLAETDQPTTLIVTRKVMLDPLRSHLGDYPNIKILTSD